jgi:hypothetical protein
MMCLVAYTAVAAAAAVLNVDDLSSSSDGNEDGVNCIILSPFSGSTTLHFTDVLTALY